MENTFSPFGLNLFGEPIKQQTESPVARRFLVAPFSVLSARDGDWQDRERAWIGLGIKGEIGRDSIVYTLNGRPGTEYFPQFDTGISIFDPVLCELIYSWFSSNSAQIVDPFAGGSVRGIVASCMGRKYWGSELRQEQVDANIDQVNQICKTNQPKYVCGDSMETLGIAPMADLIFSCPPYGDLEKYSDDPRDLSNMEWHTFVAAYKRIILRSYKVLKPNRFACFVVGDYRDGNGYYRNFVGETIQGFLDCGMKLYNEAILVTSVGTAAMRVTKQFDSGRKLCKTHQNVLVFCKGDWRIAAREAIGD